MNAAGRRAGVAVLAHAVVDFFSFIVVPLFTVLKGRVGLTQEQAEIVLAVGPVASGLVQPLIALLSDRYDTRWLGTLGFAVAVVAVGSIGFATTFPALLLIQVLSCAGIGAFHPVAAAAVGHLSGTRRSAGIAWFYAAGMAGGVAGNLVAPWWVDLLGNGSPAAGLRSLSWLIAPGLLCVLALGAATHSAGHMHAGAAAEHAALPALERRGRWNDVGLLYAANVLRFIVDMALITLIIRWTEQLALAHAGAERFTDAVRTDASHLNGPLQAAKQVGMGLGGLALGWFVAPRLEKLTLVLVPLVGAGAVAALPHTAGWAAWGVCGVAGFGCAAVMPLTIRMSQRLLPHRTSLASGLMMGGAWAVGCVGPMLARVLSERLGLAGAFAVVAGLLVVSAALAAPLRRWRVV